MSEFPQIPTLAQLGYKQDLLGVWSAFFAPAGVPAEVSKTLISALEKVMKDPAVVSKLANLGMVADTFRRTDLSPKYAKSIGLWSRSRRRRG